MYTIKLYYNTGHHYYFYPLNTLEKCDSAEIEAICNFYEIDNLDQYDPEPTLHWFNAKNAPWLRAKVITKNIYYNSEMKNITVDYEKSSCKILEIKGLLLAIDTTVGDAKKGFYITNQENVQKSDDDGKNCYIAQQEIHNNTKNLDLHTLFQDSIFKDDSTTDNENNISETEAAIQDLSLDLRIILKMDNNQIPVSLHIDFGNSRTIALRFDNSLKINTDEKLSYKTKAIYLADNSKDFYVGNKNIIQLPEDIFRKDFLVDSWITLEEPTFNRLNSNLYNIAYEHTDVIAKSIWSRIKNWFNQNDEVKMQQIRPFMYNENSFANFRIEPPLGNNVDAGRFYLSSPKKYILNKNEKEKWSMFSADDDGLMTYANLSGDYMLLREITDFTEENNIDISKLNYGHNGNNAVKLSKNEIMVLAALKIFEVSNRQILSEFLSRGARGYSKRYLKDVYITYPSGWTQKEKYEYKKIWERAKNIYLYSKYKHNISNHDITIHLDTDEAVSSSLPIIFSEIYNMNDSFDKFFTLYGNGTNARVLSLDIGGGTQDIAIIDYAYENNSLNATVLYADSNREAGDNLIKTLIENILLPYIGKKEEDIEKYNKFIKCINGENFDDSTTYYYSLIKRNIFIPIVETWLEDFNTESEITTKGAYLKRTLIDHNEITDNIFEKLYEIYGEIISNTHCCESMKQNFDKMRKLNISYDQIEQEIKKWAEDKLFNFTLLYEAFSCDLLIVSGKVSELKPIQEVISKYFTASINEVIFTKNYYAGEWLPISNNSNRILDSKLTTTVGSVLNKAIKENCFANWKSININVNASNMRYYWYIKYGNTNQCILKPNENEYNLQIQPTNKNQEISICKSFYEDGEAQEVYVLKIPQNSQGNIVIKRENELNLLTETNSGQTRNRRRTHHNIDNANNNYYDALTIESRGRGNDKIELVYALEVDNTDWLDTFNFELSKI